MNDNELWELRIAEYQWIIPINIYNYRLMDYG